MTSERPTFFLSREPKPKKQPKALKRTPLKRPQKKIRAVSAKRRKQLAVYSALRKQYLQLNPICEVWLAENGWTQIEPNMFHRFPKTASENIQFANAECLTDLGAPPSVQVHHKNKRHGSRLNDTQHWLAVSAENHERIEQNKKWAREYGFLYPI